MTLKSDAHQVKWAVLETNGEISFIKQQ